MTASLHPAAPNDLPAFISGPGETDDLMVTMAILLVLVVLTVGLLFFRLHTLPERIAHKSQKIQFEIVAVLGLLSLVTHIHAFWVAGLVLALIDFPEIGWPLRRIAGSLERIAGINPGGNASDIPDISPNITVPTETSAKASEGTVTHIEPSNGAVAGLDKIRTHPGEENVSRA